MNLEELNRHAELTKQMAAPFWDYYCFKINSYEVVGRARSILKSLEEKDELPDSTDIDGWLDWLSGMPESARDSLPITSSGSYWTALFDSDYISEKAYEEGMDDGWIEDFHATLRTIRRSFTHR